MHKGFQARFGMSFLDQLDASEDNALAGARDMWKQAMLNRIVLGAIGWVMGNADFKSDLVGQGL